MEKPKEKGCFFEYESHRDEIQFTESDSWEELDGRHIENCMGNEESQKFIFPEDLPKWRSFLKNQKGEECELRLWGRSGELHWCRFRSSAALQGSKGYKLIGYAVNIDRQMQEKEQQRLLNRLDALTGVFNPENVQLEIEAYLSSEAKEGNHAMLLVDIDDLKSINTSLGYLFGDTVIANLSRAFQESVPEDSIIGRIGGDEFLIFLKNTSGMEEVMYTAGEIRGALKEIYVGENKKLKITCCMGIVRYPLHGRTYQQLFENADRALYQAKENGKNVLQLYDQTFLHCLPEKEDGYYNQYRMHDPQSLTKSGKQEIIDFAFDIMSKTKDVTSAIKLLLEKIGREYQIDVAQILEAEQGGSRLRMTYEWHSRGNGGFYPNPQTESLLLQGGCFDERGIFVKEEQGQSALMAAFYEEGRFRGCVCLWDMAGQRSFREEEKENLIEIAKIVSFYLLKLRVSEKIAERLEHMKNYDSMTGLSTLHKFKADAACLVQEKQQRYAIIYWDIAKFKFINDTYGYQAGDRVLHDLALFLKSCLDQEDCLLARDCADKFVGLCPVTDAGDFEIWLNTIGREFHEQQREKNISVNLTVNTGVYLMEAGNTDISAAIDNANVARKTAKGGISNVCRFYDEDMQETIRREVEILNNMEEALKNREFVVYLQPKIDLEKEKPAGAEALVRWRRFDGSMVPPAEFIPLFEKNGFILQLDFFVFEEVCRTIRWWLDNAMNTVPVSVNVSRVHLNDEKFISKLKGLVDYYQVPPELLELELTESMFLDNTRAALTTMQELRKMGFSVSIDDFGAGYSSLSLLKDMATDVIKLDKEFFSHGEMLKEEKIVVSSIINMAKKLNMKVLSEGIETKNQTEFLKEMDCDLVQGYFYAKPMPIREFERFLNS